MGVAIGVFERDEIGLRRVFPAVLELLGTSATALRETGIADLTVVDQDLTSRLADDLLDGWCALFRNALVALAVVVGTDIEDSMVFTVVPADEFIVFLDEREEACSTLPQPLALLHLGQEPRTGDDGMGL